MSAAVETKAGQIRQLTFDSLAGGLESAGDGEAIRFAPARRHRGAKKNILVPGTIQQATFDDLFAATPTLERAEGIRETQKETHYEIDTASQHDSQKLAGVSSQDVQAVREREPLRAGIGGNRNADERPIASVGGHSEDGVSPSDGDSHRQVSPARRILLEEVEPQQQPSRDLRITEAHGVGSGGLHEKANANIEAIKLLQILEAEGRDATDAEKATLVRYAGWGALPQVFEPDWRVRPEWKTAAQAVKALLTEEEYEKAAGSTLNAHFTSPLVVSSIWEGLQKLGVKGNIEVLEPAMGIGHFFGLMPEALAGGHRTGVEKDPLTARIARKLYPDSTIYAQGYEETKLPDNYFDVVVGNVPFGDYGVHDPDPSMKSAPKRPIHDYFFAKSLEKVRPGGVMALITSRYTMDKQDSAVREYLADRADLVGAVRLPNTAFKGNAGTEVTTDILFLKKRVKGAAPAGEAWTATQPVQIEGTPVPLNEYYVRHPEMMLGTMSLTGTMYRGKEPTLAGELTPESITSAMNALPAGTWSRRGERVAPQPLARVEPEQLRTIKDGGYAEVNGELVMRNGDRLERVHLNAMEALRVRGMLRIRDSVRQVFSTQLEDAGEEQILEARQRLNTVYDQFVQRFGPISTSEHTRLFGTDPDHPLLLSLETYDPETKTAAKTAIFEKRTLDRYQPIEHVETATEALAVSLNEVGGIGWERMAELTGYSIRELQEELSGQVFQTPQGAWETADEYLSGDVRAKLRTAEATAAINPLFARNVEALRAVQPEDIRPGDIQARLGASWIPKSDIADFIAQTLQIPGRDVSVGHAGAIATWSVKLDFFAQRSVSNTTTYGTKRRTAADLIEDALNLRMPTVYDTLADETRVVNQTETIAAREAQQKLKDRFSAWIWEDQDRAQRLARLYNPRNAQRGCCRAKRSFGMRITS